MSSTLTRVYETYAEARAAVAELKKNRYADDEIDLFSRDTPAEGLAPAIAKAGVAKKDAPAFADEVSKGNYLVVVRAVLGAAVKASAILDRHGPIASSVGKTEYPSEAIDDKRLVSERLGFPMLLADEPAPLSAIMKVPTLLESSAPSAPAPDPKSRWRTFTFGEPKLIDKPTLLSSEIGIPVLWSGFAKKKV